MDESSLTVLVESGAIEIYTDIFFCKATLRSIRKFFGYMFQEPDRNTETISAVREYLTSKLAQKKEAWHRASVKYRNGYVDVNFKPYLSPEKIKEINCSNNRLLSAVKRTKSDYERCRKIVSIFETTKNK